MEKQIRLKFIFTLIMLALLAACSSGGGGGGSSSKKSSKSNSSSDSNSDSSISAPTAITLNSPASTTTFTKDIQIELAGVESGQTLKIYTDSSCSTLVSTVTSSGSTHQVDLTSLSAGSYEFHATVTSGPLTSDCSSASLSMTIEDCPNGYVPVPANSGLNSSEFCVMKHEARAWIDANSDGIVDTGEVDADGCLEGGCTTDNWGTGTHKPGSTDEGIGWRRISQDNAKTMCTNLGTRYDLISNPEWMAIARNVENVDANWSGATVGSGCLFRGNNGWNDACGYDGSDPEGGTGRNTKAKLTLDNGEEIWDLASNLWEWVDWSKGGSLEATPLTCDTSGWAELTAVSCVDFPNDTFNSENGTFTSTEGMGKFYGSTGGGAMVRGRYSGGGDGSGIYSTYLGYSFWNLDSLIGFRCVYR